MKTHTSRRDFATGLLAGVPIALAYFPVAVSFGVAAAKGGFTLAEALFMSLTIYAGASQFLALALLAGGGAPALAILPLLAMNARHLLYAPALLAAVHERAPLRRAWLWSFGLTDEVFASALGAWSGKRGWSEAWQGGIGLAAYGAWLAGTFTGAALGAGAFERYPAVDAALEFLLPALFLALLLAMWRPRVPSSLASVLAAAAGYLLAAPALGGSNAILLGILAGAMAGALTSQERGRR